MNAGQLRHLVYVYEIPKDVETSSVGGERRELSPSPVYASLEPYEPGTSDDRATLFRVRMRYHPEITLDSMLTYNDRRLYVRGIQNVNERDVEHRLLCEEVS